MKELMPGLAVGFNLVPSHTMLVEQCEPLRPSSWQNQEQQCENSAMQYVWQEHNYESRGKRNSRTGLLLEKQEATGDSSQQSSFKKEDAEPIAARRQAFRKSTGSSQLSAGGNENKGHSIYQQCSTTGIPSSQRNEETTVAPARFCERIDRSPPEAHNQTSEQESSQQISLTLSPTEGEDSSKSDLPVQRKRGRPPKKAKTAQEQVKQMLPSSSEKEKEVRTLRTRGKKNSTDSATEDSVNITSSRLSKRSPVQPKGSSSIISPSEKGRQKNALEGVEIGKVGSLSLSFIGKCSSQNEQPAESLQLSVDMEDGTVQASSTESPSVVRTQNTPKTKLLPAPSVQTRERRTSVTLQDAMLLVEAMNQSAEENTLCSPQQKPATTKTLQTVEEVQIEQQISPINVEAQEPADKVPQTQISTTTELTKKELNSDLQTISVTATGEVLTVIPANTAKSSMVISTAATQTSIKSLQRHPSGHQLKSVANIKKDETVPQKIVMASSLVSVIPHKCAAPSPALLPTVVPTAVVADDKSELPSSTSTGVPPKKSPLSSVISQKSPPAIKSKLTDPLGDLQSVSLPHPKITIIIPRQTSAIASKKQSQTMAVTTMHEAKSSDTVTLSSSTSSSLMSSSQDLGKSRDTQTTLDEAATVLSTKKTSDNLESSGQNISFTEPIKEPSGISSILDVSSGLESTHESQAVPSCEQKLSAIVRLTRLQLPISSKDAVLVSSLPTSGASALKYLLNEVSSSSISSTTAETSAVMRLQTSQMSDRQKNVEMEASLSPRKGICLESSTSSWLSAQFCVKTTDMDSTEPLDLSVMASEPTTSKLENRTVCKPVQDNDLPSDPEQELPSTELEPLIIEEDDEESAPIEAPLPTEESAPVEEEQLPTEESAPIEEEPLPTEESAPMEEEPLPMEKESPAVIHLMPIKSKDTSDPHVRMTKTQFLAQLAVTPILQDPKQPSINDSVDANASGPKTCTSDKKQLEKSILVAKLRRHLRTHLQARNSETNRESRTGTENPTERCDKPRLENDKADDKSTPVEPIPLSNEKQDTVLDNTSIKTTSDSPPVSTKRSSISIDGVRSKRSLKELSPEKSKSTTESTPVSLKRSIPDRDAIDSKNKKSSPVSARRSNSAGDSAIAKKTKGASASPGRPGLAKKSAISKKTKSTSVSPRRSASTKESVSPKKTRKTSVSPKRSSKTEESACPKSLKTTSVRPKRTSSTRDGPSPKGDKTVDPINSETPKRTKSIPVGPGTSSLSKSGSSPKIPADDGDSPSNIKSGTNLHSVSPSKTWESTPAKKPRVVKGSCPSKNLRVVNSKQFTKAAKDKKAQIQKHQSDLQSEAETSQLAENCANTENTKKMTTKAVWTPPAYPTKKKAPAGRKRVLQSSVKKETESQNEPSVYPPSVSLHPIPMRGQPVVSPLQPLSVIGWRLLKNQCGQCGRVLSSSAALESHVSLHTGHRPFSCRLCGKSFPDSKGLKRHGRVHRNGRIHVCPRCGKGFVYSFGLTKHLQMVHGRIKPFVCQICNKGFFSKRDVEAHIRIHTGEKPFHCNLCEKKFARRTELNMHLRWHNGEKRHWCPYCGKGFLDINNLKRHKYIHTGEKPHSCPHCPKSFTQSGHLKKHVKNVHKIV
ncbi:proteoglycan 4 isoform X2 [Cheilinus undulatus]|uniref:proteoglycan 4 isoform X2 n=1 Tax=Cheilinus undulatus TaxID=241271 RepID=UPI001BD2C529|nr:proteoglycan 4 isoform X2 [Cheilinus undulatus]XP_041640147.1 proteoglycan 4 isoform X2 [Cheilinus undulatus]